MRLLVVGLGLLSCSDYGLKVGDQGEGRPLDTSTPPDTGDTSSDTAETAETGDSNTTDTLDSPDTDTRPCADLSDPSSWTWWGSQPFDEAADPTDDSGVPWYSTSFDMVGWSTVSLPDSGHCPAGNDRVYRAWFSVPDLDHRYTFRLQSDDGIWVYINGSYVGHWGGEWQEEGCVNDDASCSEAVDVDPVNITDYLVAGDNLVAIRVSNAINNHYFDLQYECED